LDLSISKRGSIIGVPDDDSHRYVGGGVGGNKYYNR